MTGMYLIFGFLGTGKTTLIQKLLTEAFKSREVALIENDFGDFNMDAAFLREGGYQVLTLNTGCICCSLTGDFTAALASLLKAYRPDVMLIKPSGVGRLSDMGRACRDRRFATSARIIQKITIVDVKRCTSYLENLGAFFEDQVRGTGTILLNRAELFSGTVTKAVELVEQLNPSTQVLAKPWKPLTATEILSLPRETEPTDVQSHEEHTCSCGHHHHHHGRAYCCCPRAGGGADDTFDTMTLHLPQIFSPGVLGRCLQFLGSKCYGQVLRAKGIVETEMGFLNVQFLPGEHRSEETNLQERELCVIGHDLDQAQITAVSEGVCRLKMPEYTPVYMITSFLGNGKTSLLNQLLSRHPKSGHSLCCIQLEQGEQALERDSTDGGNLDLLHFPVRKLQDGTEMQQVSKQIYNYLLRDDPEGLWIEWNGALPISVLQAPSPSAEKQDGDTPGDFCQLQHMLYLADSTRLDALLQQTGGMALEQISISDVIVLRSQGPVSRFKDRKRTLWELNPSAKVLPLNSVGMVERAMLRPRRQPAFWLLLGIAYFTATYLTLRTVIGAGGSLADAMVNMFLGILLQAFPFFLIGMLLSSAIQIFVSQQWLHEHFPKRLAGGLLFAVLAGFCLPVCDYTSVPVFRSLVRKSVPPTAAVTFLMVTPAINPVIILSTWYVFNGDVRIVLCRVGLGLLCAVLVGLTFSRAGKNGLNPSGSDWFSCACGCSAGQAAEGGRLPLYLHHTQTEFFNIRKYLVLDALISALFQTLDRSFPWGNGGGGLFFLLLVLMGMIFFLSLYSSVNAVVARGFTGQFPMGALMRFMIFDPMVDVENLTLLSGSFLCKFALRLCLTSSCICGVAVFLLLSTGLERSLL